MKTKTLAQLSFAFVLTGGIVTASFQTAFGGSRHHLQQDASQQIIPDLKADQADVRELLKNVFKTVGVSYTVAPDVQGIVTLQLKNVTFETVLQNVLRQVDATYRVEGGVYNVIKRQTEVNSPMIVEDTVPIPVTNALSDSTFLYIIRGSTISKIRKSDLTVVATKHLQ